MVFKFLLPDVCLSYIACEFAFMPVTTLEIMYVSVHTDFKANSYIYLVLIWISNKKQRKNAVKR